MKDRSDNGVDREEMKENIIMEDVLEAGLEKEVETLPSMWDKKRHQRGWLL